MPSSAASAIYLACPALRAGLFWIWCTITLPYSSSLSCTLCSQVREILAFGTADHVGARVELEEFAMQVRLFTLIDAGFAKWQFIVC